MTKYLKHRWILTFVWVLFFILILLLVESFFHMHDASGVPLLLPEDRVSCWEPVRNLYFPYLGGILTFWFVKPFAAAKTDKAERIRFLLALTLTCLFNIIIIYFIAQTHIAGYNNANAVADVQTAVKVGGWFSFIVAPVLGFYFGMKKEG